MELNYGYSKSDYKKKVSKTQVVVECNLLKQEGGISKLLSSDASAKITSYELLNGEVKFDMSVDFCAVLNDENGIVDSLSYTEYCSDEIKNKEITPNLQALFDCQVIDMQTISINNNKLVLQCIVEITLSLISGEEIKYLESASSEIIFKKCKQNTNMLISKVREKFDVEEKFLHKGDIDKVLMVQNQCKIKKVSSGLDCVTIYGEVLFNVILCSYESNSNVFQKQFSIDFERELEAANVNIGQIPTAKVTVDSSAITVNVEDNDECVIDVKASLICDVCVFDKCEIETVQDVFSLTDELEVVRNCYDTMTKVEDFYSIEKLNGVAAIAENMPSVDRLLAPICNNVMLTNLTCFEGYVLCEGVVSSSIAYCNDETVHSVNLEMPFSVNIKNNAVMPDSIATADLILTDTMAKHKKTDSIDMYAELLIDIKLYSLSQVISITDVKVLEPKAQSSGGISVYIARENEELFEVAKALNVSTETIAEQNDGITFPLENGEKVVIFRQHNPIL